MVEAQEGQGVEAFEGAGRQLLQPVVVQVEVLQRAQVLEDTRGDGGQLAALEVQGAELEEAVEDSGGELGQGVVHDVEADQP